MKQLHAERRLGFGLNDEVTPKTITERSRVRSTPGLEHAPAAPSYVVARHLRKSKIGSTRGREDTRHAPPAGTIAGGRLIRIGDPSTFFYVADANGGLQDEDETPTRRSSFSGHEGQAFDPHWQDVYHAPRPCSFAPAPTRRVCACPLDQLNGPQTAGLGRRLLGTRQYCPRHGSRGSELMRRGCEGKPLPGQLAARRSPEGRHCRSVRRPGTCPDASGTNR